MTEEERKAKTRERQRKWCEANREKRQEQHRKRYEANREKEREGRRKYYEANREKVLERQRKRREANPEKEREVRRKHYEANQEKLRGGKRERRKGKAEALAGRPKPELCEACGRPPTKLGIVFDHCHKSDVFRGWLCNSCNIVLGLMRDSPTLLRKLAQYIEANDVAWLAVEQGRRLGPPDNRPVAAPDGSRADPRR